MTDRIRISRGETINRGNYESTRVDVSIEREYVEIITYEDNIKKLSDAVEALLEMETRKADKHR